MTALKNIKNVFSLLACYKILEIKIKNSISALE